MHSSCSSATWAGTVPVWSVSYCKQTLKPKQNLHIGEPKINANQTKIQLLLKILTWVKYIYHFEAFRHPNKMSNMSEVSEQAAEVEAEEEEEVEGTRKHKICRKKGGSLC